MASTIKQMGRHRVPSVDDIPPPSGNPKEFLAANLLWSEPSVTTHFQEFTAGTDILKHQALVVQSDGKAVLGHHESLDQYGKYVGIAAADALVDEKVYSQMYGLVYNSSWNWTVGLPVFVGTGGQLTQGIPTTGYRQVAGVAHSPTSIFMQMYLPVITAGSSDGFFRQNGENGGEGGISLNYATPQDIRDGVDREKVINPWALNVVRQQDIIDYGVTPDKFATLEDVNNGVAGKLITASILKQYIQNQGGGGADVSWATTNEILQGTRDDVAFNPKAFKPILESLQNMQAQLDWATAAEVAAGTEADKIVSPLALRPIIEQLQNALSALTAKVPDAATSNEVDQGVRDDVYVAPKTLKEVTDAIRAVIPVIATAADIAAGATDRVVTAAQLKAAREALEAVIPKPATAADIAEGTSTTKYINVVQFKDALDNIGGTVDLTDIENRLDALESVVIPAFATVDEAKEGLLATKIISPYTLKAVIDSVTITGATFASVEEAIAGTILNKSMSPGLVAAVMAANQNWLRDDNGSLFPRD